MEDAKLLLQVGYLVTRDGRNVRTIFNEEANLYFDHEGKVIGAGDKRAKSTFMPPKFLVQPMYVKHEPARAADAK
jgi:hypothetical protein